MSLLKRHFVSSERTFCPCSTLYRIIQNAPSESFFQNNKYSFLYFSHATKKKKFPLTGKQKKFGVLKSVAYRGGAGGNPPNTRSRVSPRPPGEFFVIVSFLHPPPPFPHPFSSQGRGGSFSPVGFLPSGAFGLTPWGASPPNPPKTCIKERFCATLFLGLFFGLFCSSLSPLL